MNISESIYQQTESFFSLSETPITFNTRQLLSRNGFFGNNSEKISFHSATFIKENTNNEILIENKIIDENSIINTEKKQNKRKYDAFMNHTNENSINSTDSNKINKTNCLISETSKRILQKNKLIEFYELEIKTLTTTHSNTHPLVIEFTKKLNREIYYRDLMKKFIK